MPHLPPPKVRIGGKTITVRVCTEIEDWGQYNSDAGEILISAKAIAKRSTLISTLRHEMLHAALDICGLSYLKNYEEETIVRCLDNVFYPAWNKTRKQIP